MSRRALGSALLAAGLLTSGAAPFLSSAHAAGSGCVSWTATKDNANFQSQAALADKSMDIVGVSLATVGTDVVASITVQQLNWKTSQQVGDRYSLSGNFGGTNLIFWVERDDTGTRSGIDNITTSSTAADGAATVTWDYPANTVEISTTPAELDKAVGHASAGTDATGLSAGTKLQIGGQGSGYDPGAPAPDGTTYVIGAACDPPLGTLPMPKADCGTNDAGTGDGTAEVSGNKTGNDTDLDITSFAVNSTDKKLFAYLKVSTLGDKPANFTGDRFEFHFTVGANAYTYAVGRQTVGTNLTQTTYGQKNNTATTPPLGVVGRFLKASNTVVIEIDRTGLDAANGTPVADGVTATAVSAKSFALAPDDAFTADTVQGTAPADSWTIGQNPCFPPPPGVLANVGKVVGQYSDAIAFATKLTTKGGVALAGKTVSFKLGSKTLPTAKTGTDGVARLTVNPGLPAGAYNLVTAFAGDDSAGPQTLTTPVTISIEKTAITLSVIKSGSNRTVVAKLLDDDKHAVSGVTLVWYINGKKVSSAKTNSAGTATLKTAKPTQTVKAYFATVSGKYQTASATKKV